MQAIIAQIAIMQDDQTEGSADPVQLAQNVLDAIDALSGYLQQVLGRSSEFGDLVTQLEAKRASILEAKEHCYPGDSLPRSATFEPSGFALDNQPSSATLDDIPDQSAVVDSQSLL